MTSKRPVTHPALQRAYSTHEPAFGEPRPHGVCVCPCCVLETAPPDAPREPLGGAEAPSGTTGRGEGSDAADGRTAARIGVVQAAAQAITEEASAGWLTCTPLGFAKALADAGLLRDDAADEWRAELVAIVRAVREQNDRLTRERDDLLEAVKPANDYALCKGYTTFSGGVDRVRHEVGLLARDIALAEERAERAERERDDLLAMQARVEALADEWAGFGTHTSFRQIHVTAAEKLRDAIRGEFRYCGRGPCCKEDGHEGGCSQ